MREFKVLMYLGLMLCFCLVVLITGCEKATEKNIQGPDKKFDTELNKEIEESEKDNNSNSTPKFTLNLKKSSICLKKLSKLNKI